MESVTTPRSPGRPAQTVINCDGTDASVTVSHYGATITSWNVCGQEKLFVSRDARRDGSKPIRGGIPVVFPQFGSSSLYTNEAPDELPSHGFARRSMWKLQTDGHGEAIFELESNDATRAQWNYDFKLTYTIRLLGHHGRSVLQCELGVENTGKQSFGFHALLHNYFAVDNIEDVVVDGFSGCSYNDKLNMADVVNEKDERPELTIDREVDRIYVGSQETTLTEGDAEKLIVQHDFQNCVVWNAWAEKAQRLSDMADDEYKVYVCLEPGNVQEVTRLPAGEAWHGRQIITDLIRHRKSE